MANKLIGQKRRQKDLKRRKKLLSRKRAEHTNPGLPVVSTALLEYAHPLFEIVGDDSAESLEVVISIAAECWNIGGYPNEISRDMQSDFTKAVLEDASFPSEVRQEFSGLISSLIDTRRQNFGEDPRFIVDYEIFWLGDEYRLRVMSSVLPRELIAADITIKTESA